MSSVSLSPGGADEFDLVFPVESSITGSDHVVHKIRDNCKSEPSPRFEVINHACVTRRLSGLG